MLWENDCSVLKKTGFSHERRGLETQVEMFCASLRNETHFLKVKV